jgi:hypothetical protein
MEAVMQQTWHAALAGTSSTRLKPWAIDATTKLEQHALHAHTHEHIYT